MVWLLKTKFKTNIIGIENKITDRNSLVKKTDFVTVCRN